MRIIFRLGAGKTSQQTNTNIHAPIMASAAGLGYKGPLWNLTGGNRNWVRRDRTLAITGSFSSLSNCAGGENNHCRQAVKSLIHLTRSVDVSTQKQPGITPFRPGARPPSAHGEEITGEMKTSCDLLQRDVSPPPLTADWVWYDSCVFVVCCVGAQLSSCRLSNYPTSAAFALRVKTCGFNLEKQLVVESQTCGGNHKGKVKWNERRAIGKQLGRKNDFLSKPS